MNIKALDIIVLLLIIIGAFNWGLIVFFNFNLIETIFGIGAISTLIYILVGLSGLYSISFFTRKNIKRI